MGTIRSLVNMVPSRRDQLIRPVLVKIERSNASRKKIRRYNSRSTTCSWMNHKAGINGHTWHSFAIVLVKVDDVLIAMLLATKKFPFLSFLLSFSCFIRSCTSAPPYAEACTDETGTCASFFQIPIVLTNDNANQQIKCVYKAHRALELLEDYHAKLTRPQDKQLRLAIERVIRIFKSRLFQALLGCFRFRMISRFLRLFRDENSNTKMSKPHLSTEAAQYQVTSHPDEVSRDVHETLAFNGVSNTEITHPQQCTSKEKRHMRNFTMYNIHHTIMQKSTEKSVSKTFPIAELFVCGLVILTYDTVAAHHVLTASSLIIIAESPLLFHDRGFILDAAVGGSNCTPAAMILNYACYNYNIKTRLYSLESVGKRHVWETPSEFTVNLANGSEKWRERDVEAARKRAGSGRRVVGSTVKYCLWILHPPSYAQLIPFCPDRLSVYRRALSLENPGTRS
ncbi:Disks large 1 tumor suppressor protein [Acromyrmex echinatior]|uniref:Disks large 1 tumor suppressor protein n=1 Tax=Acromyrmex echinatior TaxID=103372 RepID=F4WKZ6_ACREC|nr:Disks large 1 tumor suppressor protein [Acromyrmex echinatior]